MQAMDASDYAAWYGAAVGTLAVGWDVYLHLTKGPKLEASGGYSAKAQREGLGVLSCIVVDIYNKGNEGTRIESFRVVQGGTGFKRALTNIPSMGLSIGNSPVLIEAGGHLVIDVHPTDAPDGPLPTPATPYRKLDPFKPATVYLKWAASKKEIVFTVDPITAEEVQPHPSASHG